MKEIGGGFQNLYIIVDGPWNIFNGLYIPYLVKYIYDADGARWIDLDELTFTRYIRFGGLD